MKYEIRRYSPDGDSITDHGAATVREAWKDCGDSGSRWYFYPICVAVRAGSDKKRGRIIDAPEMIEHYIGKTCGTLEKRIRAVAAEIGNTPTTLEGIMLSL